MRFNDLESRLNRACIRHLANADAVMMHDGAPVTISGIFEAAYVEALGLGGSRPALQVQMSADITTGTAITVRGVAYTVRGVQPDGTGLTRLLLEKS